MTTTTTPEAATPTTAAPATQTAAQTPMLIMGPTRVGKTSLLATLAEYVWEEYGKISHFYQVDGGGFPAQMEALKNHGIVRLWRLRSRSARGLAFETCRRAAQGWWPTKVNPRTGEVDPAAKLVPPVTVRTLVFCPNGHQARVAMVPAQLQLTQACPTCKVMVTPQNMTTQTITEQTPGFEKVGAALYDGASSMCAWFMDDLSERAGRNELGGEKGALGTIVSGDLAIGGANRAMYGTVQAQAEAMVLASSAVPNLVVPPAWTALVQEASDDGGLSIRGPLLAGSAKTAVAPQWFGDVIEATISEVGGKKYRQLRLQTYIDEKGIRHLCGVRSFPGTIPDVLEEVEGEAAPFSVFSLGHYYRLRDAAITALETQYAGKYIGAPGLEEVTYGGEAAASASPAAPAPAAPPKVAPRPGSPAARAQAKRAPATPATADASPAPPAAPPAAPPQAAPPAAPPAAAPAPPATPPAGATAGTPPLTPAQRARLAKAPGAVRAPNAVPAAASAAPAPTGTAPVAQSGPVPPAPTPVAPLPPAAGPLASPPGRRP